MTYPLRIAPGETLANEKALDRYMDTQKRRAAGKGHAAEIAKYHLERIEKLNEKK